MEGISFAITNKRGCPGIVILLLGDAKRCPKRNKDKRLIERDFIDDILMCKAWLDNWQLICEYRFGLTKHGHLSAETFSSRISSLAERCN